MSENQLRIFAQHVTEILTGEATFTLYFGIGVRAVICIEDEATVYVNDKWVGNRRGAVSEYTRMVADATCTVNA